MRYFYAPAVAAALLLTNMPEAAHAEYNNLLRNIYSAAESNARSRARSQGRLVSNLTSGFIDRAANAIPSSRASDAVSAFSGYVGTAVGGAWERRAAQVLTTRARSEVSGNEPQIRSQFDAGQARSAERQRYEARQRAIQERRARTYGPPKPNAFY
jgi:hypothetical protein